VSELALSRAHFIHRAVRPLLSLFWLALAIPLAAAGAPAEIKWTEEVRLHDGKVIQVKRRTELAPTGFPTAARGRPLYHELCYAPMGIHWKSNPAYEPELFDLVDGKAYVRVPLRGCSSCKLHDFPRTNSLYFMWESGKWSEIAAQAFPPQARFNLLSSTHWDDDGAHDARGLVSLADKAERDGSIYQELKALGAKSTTERRGHRDLCERCSRMNIRTNAPQEVLLPSNAAACKW
jgi:hypothetical protein